MHLLVRNFKSVDELQLELGRVNLFIGANGCGKTSILEAVGMLAAAAMNNLSNAALKDRGIRVTESMWMRSAFDREARAQPVELMLYADKVGACGARLTHDNTPYGQWTNVLAATLATKIERSDDELARFFELYRGVDETEWSNVTGLTDAPKIPEDIMREPESARERYWSLISFGSAVFSQLHKFLNYAPREDVLRDLARESDVEPIGIHGEGLFKLLQVLEAEGQLPQVKEQLALLDWFDDISVAAGVNPSSRSLQIRDVFLQGPTPFDQRSANEGFLFVLLYACLLISKYTPKFFAIDNVDTALNPKLCARTVKMFAELTRQYDRRVLLTAHNPGALDGLDLNDDEQRLFVVYRNIEGRTRVRRILPADLPAGEEPVRLSEAFLRGYLGALPTNF